MADDVTPAQWRALAAKAGRAFVGLCLAGTAAFGALRPSADVARVDAVAASAKAADARVDDSWERFTRPALIFQAQRLDAMQEEIVQLRIAHATMLADRDALVRELLDAGAVEDAPRAPAVRVKRAPKRARARLPRRLVE